MKNKLGISLMVGFLFFIITLVQAQIKRIDPTNWWVGMENPKLQLLVYGENIGSSEVSLKKYKGVKLKGIQKVENNNYLFIDLEIQAKAKAGKLSFTFSDNVNSFIQNYELKEKEEVNIQSIIGNDVIYLLMPDRFSNGDYSNDKFADMMDPDMDRSNPWLRHGGDLQGVSNHMDYFKDLGITALWLNPVIENDQPQTNEGGDMRSAYHGYGFTDHYNVDKRLGGNAAYKEMIEKAHLNGIKIIQDAVYNHVGINHYFLKDMPMKSWLNQWETYTNTNYKGHTVPAPNSSVYDKSRTTDGWFMPFLPDLNQNNPLVANYLIQHAIWTVQEFGIDAFRIDTYMYNDMDFMNSCNDALKKQFPNIFLFGESLASPMPNQAAFVRNKMELPFMANIESTVDYQLHMAMLAGLKENYGWNEGVNRMYQILTLDYLYQTPDKLVTYLDNHDENRFLSEVGEDMRKFKMGLSWLMTIRGIPEIYYGTELAVKNFKNPTDAEVRKDFPGGWKEDDANKFKVGGRTKLEQETFEFTKKLIQIRKESKAICKGTFTQFLPFDDGIYAYFRIYDDESIMVISNASENEHIVDVTRFEEVLKGKREAEELLTDKKTDLSNLRLGAFEVKVLKILK
jgi:neopullulanase